MFQRTFSIIIALAFGLTTASLMSQELNQSGVTQGSKPLSPAARSPAPARDGTEPAQPSANLRSVESIAPASAPPRVIDSSNRWRYRWHNGHWWYWTVQNEWLLWRGDRWVTLKVPSARNATSGSAASMATPARQSYQNFQVDPAGSSVPQYFQQSTGGYHTEPGYSNLHRGGGFPVFFQQGAGGYHTEPGYSNLHRLPGLPTFQQGTPGYYDGYGNQYYGDPRDQGYYRYYGWGGDFYSD